MALKLSFRDNSEHESGFHVYRSDAPMDPRNLPKPYKDLGRNSSVVIDEDFGGIFDQRRYYRVASYVKGGNRSVSEEAHAGYDGKSPTLNLDFASLQYAVAQGIGLDLSPRAFSDLITFTRPTGGGITNAQGNHEWLPANMPRIDYDPVTGECRGLLVEEQRTNLLTYSSDFANAAWTKLDALVTPNAAVAPDGSVSASKLAASTDSSGSHRIYEIRTGDVFSLFVKAGEFSKVRLASYDGIAHRGASFDLVSGTVTGKDSEVVQAGVTPLGSGWYRIHIVKPGGTYQSVFLLNNSGSQVFQGDGTSGIYIWGAQLEVGSFPTSYIPTTTAQVTRAADIASVNELSPWYNSLEGTLFVEYSAEFLRSAARAAAFGPTAAGSYLGIGATGGSNTGGYSNGLSGLPSVISGAVARQALAYAAGSMSGSANGSSVITRTGSDFTGSSTQLLIGQNNNSNSRLNGHIRSIRYFPRRLSDTELQAMTA